MTDLRFPEGENTGDETAARGRPGRADEACASSSSRSRPWSHAGDELVLILGQGRTGQIPAKVPLPVELALRRRAEHAVAGRRRPAAASVLHAARPGGAAAAVRRGSRSRRCVACGAGRGAGAAPRRSPRTSRSAQAARPRLPRADPLGRLHQPRADERAGGAAGRLRAASRSSIRGYLEFTTVAEELGDPNAVSLGPDGKPAVGPGGREGRLPVLRREGHRRERARQREGLRPAAQRAPRRAVRAGGRPALPRGPAHLARDRPRPRARRRHRACTTSRTRSPSPSCCGG